MELLKDQMNRIFIVILSFLIIGMIYLFSYSLSKPEISRINNQIGKDLPEFKNLVDLNQEIFDQEEILKGKVLLNVWASWCITCKVEHPFLKKISEEKNLKIVGINYKDQLSDAISYLEDNGDPYDNSIFDLGGDYSLKLGVIGAPETFLVIDGKIVSHRVGELNRKIWEREFESFF